MITTHASGLMEIFSDIIYSPFPCILLVSVLKTCVPFPKTSRCTFCSFLYCRETKINVRDISLRNIQQLIIIIIKIIIIIIIIIKFMNIFSVLRKGEKKNKRTQNRKGFSTS